MGNPKNSQWYSTPREMRKRKPIAITLSVEAMIVLDALSARWRCSKSQAIDRLLCEHARDMV